MYIVQIEIVRNTTLQTAKGNGSLNISITLKMHNPHGYLSAVDYPALVVSVPSQAHQSRESCLHYYRIAL